MRLTRSGPSVDSKAVEVQLERMKRQFSHILRNGQQATISYSDWGAWQRRLRKAAETAAKKKGIVRVAVPKALTKLGKASKVVPFITFTYVASTNSVAAAAEGCTEDLLWPFLDIGRSAAEYVTGPLVRAVDDLHQRHRRAEANPYDPESYRPGGNWQKR